MHDASAFSCSCFRNVILCGRVVVGFVKVDRILNSFIICAIKFGLFHEINMHCMMVNASNKVGLENYVCTRSITNTTTQIKIIYGDLTVTPIPNIER